MLMNALPVLGLMGGLSFAATATKVTGRSFYEKEVLVEIYEGRESAHHPWNVTPRTIWCP